MTTRITDTDRLDYLERTEQPLYTVVSRDLSYDCGGCQLVYYVDGWVVGYNTGSHSTPRQAIDAAMKLQQT